MNDSLATAANLLARGAAPQARAMAERLFAARPSAELHHFLGAIAMGEEQFDTAARHFTDAARLAPDDLRHRCGHAEALTAKGDDDGALREFATVLATDSNALRALIGRASLLERRGDLDEAIAVLADVVERGDEDGEAASVHATILQQRGDHAAARSLLVRHTTASTASPALQRKLLYRLGRSLESLQEHHAAFIAWQSANALATSSYTPANDRRRSARIRAAYAPQLTHPTSTCRSTLPVFIVGMPRSGSTLIEQILAAHPQVHAAGERPNVPKLVAGLSRRETASASWPECAGTLAPAALDTMAGDFIDELTALAPTATRIIDKNLYNHLFLGLIAQLVPAARVIHARRMPQNVALSCFASPLIPHQNPWSLDLRNIGARYGQYEHLMAFWHDVSPLPILDIDHEALVSEPEPQIRRLLEFLELPWHDACLTPHTVNRAVRTTSYDQVRQPISTARLSRAEPFAADMKPFMAALKTERGQEKG